METSSTHVKGEDIICVVPLATIVTIFSRKRPKGLGMSLLGVKNDQFSDSILLKGEGYTTTQVDEYGILDDKNNKNHSKWVSGKFHIYRFHTNSSNNSKQYNIGSPFLIVCVLTAITISIFNLSPIIKHPVTL